MKKLYFIPLLLLTLFIGVNKVKADTYYSYATNWYNNYSSLSDISSNYSTIIDNLTSYYNEYLSSDYPYYFIHYSTTPGNFALDLLASPTNEFYSTQTQSNASVCPNTATNSVVHYIYNGSSYYLYEPTDAHSCTNTMFYTSNTNMIFKANSGNADALTLPSYSDLSEDIAYPLQDIADGEIIPTYTSLLNGPTAGYTEVDLSDYSYIILSLKNYNTPPFNTTIYTLGRLCFTPVWDYGMKPKADYFSGYQTAGCTDYYNSTTPVNVFIIQGDIDNHAVFYIKQYENETDIVRIPSSIFDITYITQEDASNPNVVINGRSYPTIPFSSLTDTANKSTIEGYISGQVCALGDMNCVLDANNISSFSDIFNHPLQTLETVWSSIVSIFAVITAFITLLPPTLQTFMYASFMLAVILGLIKLVLGG